MKAKEPITDYAKLDLNGIYSYKDYLNWHFKERVELIKGKVRKMSPAPNNNHQGILSVISNKFYNFLETNRVVCILHPSTSGSRFLNQVRILQ